MPQSLLLILLHIYFSVCDKNLTGSFSFSILYKRKTDSPKAEKKKSLWLKQEETSYISRLIWFKCNKLYAAIHPHPLSFELNNPKGILNFTTGNGYIMDYQDIIFDPSFYAKKTQSTIRVE